MANTFSFIPHATPTVLNTAQTPSQSSKRLKIAYDLEILANGSKDGSAIEMAADLRGPGDIIGIDRNVISRVEPRQGLRGFEPNYFPFVEFVDADFPWRYSLDLRSGHKKEPWLVLVVLQANEFKFVESSSSVLPKIQIESAERSLPDLSQSWAYAHLQVNGDATDPDLLAVDQPTHISRLLCPRKLEPQKSYYGFLVPAFEAGRLVGVGKTNDAAPYNKKSWQQTDMNVELPVYFKWRFTTDALEDIELLLRRLKALDQTIIDDIADAKRASASNPSYYSGYAIDPSSSSASFNVQAAMRISGQTVKPYNTDPVLATKMKATLEEVVSGETDIGINDEDPLVAFPPYGFRYKPEKSVSLQKARSNEWFDRINLDLQFRHAAQLGAQIVKKNQEMLSHYCWEQYEDIAESNEKLARLQAASTFARLLAAKHFKKLPEDVVLSLSQPLQDFVKVNKTQTVSDVLKQKGVPLSYPARTLRRQSAKRQVRQSTSRKAVKIIAMPAIPGDRNASATTVIVKRPIASTRGGKRRISTTPDKLSTHTILMRTELSKLFKGDKTFLQGHVQTPLIEVASFSSKQLARPIQNAFVQLPIYKARLNIFGLKPAEQAEIKPVWRAPNIPLPMVDYLKRIDQNAILSGSDKLPENTVSFFEENRLFVEAVLVGMNHEMNNELRWREFPTDLRGTIFKRFWDRSLPIDNVDGDDIDYIHKWRKKLGKNVPQGFANADENLIMVIKGDVVRKLVNPIIVINIADKAGKFIPNQGRNIEPSFTGTLGPDTAYYGFEVSRNKILALQDKVSLVIYEPVGKLRFGLDIGSAKVRQSRRVYTEMAYSFPMAALNKAYKTEAPSQFKMKTIAAPSVPKKWDDLSWSHMRLFDSGYIDFDKTISATSESEQHWSSEKSSASLARSFWQKPIAAVLPLKRVI